MTISSVNTLLIFLVGFGVFGLTRGPEREIWTLGGVALTMLLLFFGGSAIFEQLPVRIMSGVLALAGNQDGSNSAAAHPLQQPWTLIVLWLVTAALVFLAYFMGYKFAKPNDNRDFGNYAGGFVMGAINGAFICIFLFSQGGFQNLNIQFPDGTLTRTSIAPLILVGIVVTIIAITLTTRGKAASGGKP